MEQEIQPVPPGTLAEREPHPAALTAAAWLRSLPLDKLATWREAFASSALAGNRCAEICGETLRRLMEGQAVSDRYVLGVAWILAQSGEAIPRVL